LIVGSVPLFVVSLVVWLLNVEQAFSAAGVHCVLVSGLLPESLVNKLLPLTVDLSTITTLVPVLLFVFPFFMGMRLLYKQKRDAGYRHRIVYDPYPPHFPFFLVMLGLTGTLYGLLIGLSSSGVDEIAAAVPSADSIRETVDRLLAGTATALLSSLLGLVGAFLAARPFTWWFRSMAGIPEDEGNRSLSETVSGLVRDMQALSHASREFGERLNVASADSIDQRLTAIESAIGRLATAVESTSDNIGVLVELQKKSVESLAALEKLEQLSQLSDIVKSSGAIEQSTVANGAKLSEICVEQQKVSGCVDRLSAKMEEGQGELRRALDDIAKQLGESRRDMSAERSAVRDAIGHYIENLAGRNEQR
jgi:hypothetical protein